MTSVKTCNGLISEVIDRAPRFYGVISKTAPAPEAPPTMVVLYKFPTASKIRLAIGFSPSVQPKTEQKLYSTVSVHLPFAPGDNSKTTPQQLLPTPPMSVVPYRFPAASNIMPASGAAPSAQPVEEQKL